MQNLLNKIMDDCKPYAAEGVVASYIPELKKANPSDFGICVIENGGEISSVGDCDVRFTMQSVVKPLILLLSLMDSGFEQWMFR